MRILILGGFLGSGKTSLLLRLSEAYEKISKSETPLAFIENEIGSLSIDDAMVEQKGYRVTKMLSGCACCTSAVDLPIAIQNIERDINPELLIIEASGVALPSKMQEGVASALGVTPRICVLVDAKRWRRTIVPMRHLLVDQLESADVVLVNKVDLVDEAELAFVHESLGLYITAGTPVIETSLANELAQEAFDAVIGENADGGSSLKVKIAEAEDGEHHHHEHDQLQRRVDGERGCAIIAARQHESITVASVAIPEIELASDAHQVLAQLLKDLSGDLAAQDALIGHIKLFAQQEEGTEGFSFSQVEEGFEPMLRGSYVPCAEGEVFEINAAILVGKSNPETVTQVVAKRLEQFLA